MTEAQRRFVELEKRRDEYKKFHEDLSAALVAIAEESGIGSYFQDDDGIVYKIVAPAGRWVTYEALSYVRTKRDGESKGSLSAKEAGEAGFALGK